MAKDVLILIPAYNEEDRIANVLESLQTAEYQEFADILVVNDASKDNTARVARQCNATVISQSFNMGYGSALQLGYKFACRRGYKYIIQLDADGQHDAVNVKTIYEELKKADPEGNCPDIVIGSRFMGDSKVNYNIGAVKMIGYYLFSGMIRLFTGTKIKDVTSGLQGLNYKVFSYYSMYNRFDDKYPDANMITQMLLLGCKVREIPSVMHGRTGGKSMHSGLAPFIYVIRMMLSITAVVIRVRRGDMPNVSDETQGGITES